MTIQAAADESPNRQSKLGVGTTMDVKIQEVEADLGNKGILLRVSEPNGGAAVGRLRVGRANLRWYRGRTSKNYKQVPMAKFVEWLDSH
jgi:hypothetical protein